MKKRVKSVKSAKSKPSSKHKATKPKSKTKPSSQSFHNDMTKKRKLHHRLMHHTSIILQILSWFLIAVFGTYFMVDLYFGKFVEMLLLALIIVVLYPGLYNTIEKKYKVWVPVVLRLFIVILLLSFYVAITSDEIDYPDQQSSVQKSGKLTNSINTVIDAGSENDVEDDTSQQAQSPVQTLPPTSSSNVDVKDVKVTFE